jgi:hypothetical protein
MRLDFASVSHHHFFRYEATPEHLQEHEGENEFAVSYNTGS